MKIKVNISDAQSIANAVSQIKNYEKSLDAKAQSVLTELAKKATKTVSMYFAWGEGDDYDVSCVVNGNNAMIIAEGSDVVFLEFGAGTETEDHTAGMESEGLPPIYPGSYSQLEGRGFFREDHQFWYYDHKKYTKLTPTRGFFYASQEIKDEAVKVAIKVFKK